MGGQNISKSGRAKTWHLPSASGEDRYVAASHVESPCAWYPLVPSPPHPLLVVPIRHTLQVGWRLEPRGERHRWSPVSAFLAFERLPCSMNCVGNLLKEGIDRCGKFQSCVCWFVSCSFHGHHALSILSLLFPSPFVGVWRAVIQSPILEIHERAMDC